jgi:Family of unknown function (DUF6282)
LHPFQLPRWQFTDCCDSPPRGLHAAAASADATPADGGGSAAAQPRKFPPPPPAVSPITDLIDTHFHSGPDVFGRALDDEQGAQLYKDHGMGGIVLKNHVTSTADRAWFVRKHLAGIKVFGGIALNAAVGGINPDAVQWMWRMQGGYGRCVWFPTVDSDHHVKHFQDAPEGIKVLGPDGNVLPAVREVLKICAQQKLVVNTGHLSPAEALAVIAAARDQNVERIIVTHAQFEVVNMSLEEMRKAVMMGAKIELCAAGTLMGPQAHLPWMRAWRQVRIQESVEAIQKIGPKNFVLGTDLGQSGNPSHADGLQMYVSELMANGIMKDQIQTMGREVAGSLLMG